MTKTKPVGPTKWVSSVRDADIVTTRSLTRRMALASAIAALGAAPAAAQRMVSDTDTGAGGDPAWWGRGATGALTDTDPSRDPAGRWADR